MSSLKALVKTTVILLTGGGFYFVGACAEKSFELDTNCGQGCIIQAGFKVWDYKITPKSGKIDIVIINDNSASMSPEQNKIAERFNNFIQNLDSQRVDYRIGMITTDISSAVNGPTGANGNGAWQDGKLIRFADGSSWIENTNPNRVQLFSRALTRDETINCENFLRSNPNVAQESPSYLANCPSGDERGIHAAYSFVENNSRDFLRANTDLAMILLSDEDSRSGLYTRLSNFILTSKDQPQNLINLIQNRFPEKNFRFHSIIVRPGDQACLNAQTAQMGFGATAGTQYANLTNLTKGVLADICSSDYAGPLAQIADNIHESFLRHNLKCENPKPLEGRDSLVSFIPTGNFATSVQGNQLVFDPAIRVGTTAHLQYRCPN